jgi:Spy/CpxP family protein refolding chaperone
MISIDMTKAKNIAHEKRRTSRSAEFAPLDIKVTIPAEATAAEEARQAIREKYASLQAQMDAAQTPEQLKALLPEA